MRRTDKLHLDKLENPFVAAFSLLFCSFISLGHVWIEQNKWSARINDIGTAKTDEQQEEQTVRRQQKESHLPPVVSSNRNKRKHWILAALSLFKSNHKWTHEKHLILFKSLSLLSLTSSSILVLPLLPLPTAVMAAMSSVAESSLLLLYDNQCIFLLHLVAPKCWHRLTKL